MFCMWALRGSAPCSGPTEKLDLFPRSPTTAQMARAMGGPSFFHHLSPSVLLDAAGDAAAAARKAALEAAARAAAAEGPTLMLQPAAGVVQPPAPPLDFYGGFELLGDAIPTRAGAAAGPVTGSSIGGSQGKGVLNRWGDSLGLTTDWGANIGSTPRPGLPALGAQGLPEGGSAAVNEEQKALLAAAAPDTPWEVLPGLGSYLPPCFILSGLTDHMVPWHEGAELTRHLAR